MTRPNILIFMTDHQRGDTVGENTLTPNIDKLAKEGITFTEAFCPTPHCCPSRATFMTGLYPSRHGVWNNISNEQALSIGLNEGIETWHDWLREGGYEQHWSGKWHVSMTETPKDRGCIENFVSACEYYPRRWDNYQELAKRPVVTERGEGMILRPGYGDYTAYGVMEPSPEHHDVRTVKGGLEALRQLKNADKPWCLYVGLIGPHDPYFVPQQFLDMYDIDDIELPENYADDLEDKPHLYQRMRRQIFDQLSEREVRESIRHFRAYCTYLDYQFGQILQGLEETGQADNTLVIYTADHGDYCGDHGLFAKGIPCFRGAYHVPAVMRWPQGIANPGRRENAFISLADFGPTFADLAGVTPKEELTGKSFAPFFREGKPQDWREEIFTQCNGVELYAMQRSITTKKWKYTYNGFDWDELYDLENDPHEMKNLARLPEYNEIREQLVTRIWKFAYREKDVMHNSYITTGLAPVGPAVIFK
jgi:arylsulfatase A-like enzyme